MLSIKSIRVDPIKEKEGVWVEYPETFAGPNGEVLRLEFLIARANNPAFNEYYSKISEPYRKSMRMGDLPKETQEHLVNRTYAHTCLLGWRVTDLATGNELDLLDDEGNPLPYSHEAAFKMLSDEELAPISRFVVTESQNSAHFRTAVIEETAKNSPDSSTGGAGGESTNEN